jgi:hypothetical protein
MYDASLKSYQKTDGVLRPGVPFRACLPTKLGIQQLLVKSRLLRGHSFSSSLLGIPRHLFILEYNLYLVFGEVH